MNQTSRGKQNYVQADLPPIIDYVYEWVGDYLYVTPIYAPKQEVEL